LCGVRTEQYPPGVHTGGQISPPNLYVGGGLQMLTDIAVDPAGNVWAMNNWQDIDSCIGTPSFVFPKSIPSVNSSMALLLCAQLIALPPCRIKAADHSINLPAVNPPTGLE
jgi:hypothetical protein